MAATVGAAVAWTEAVQAVDPGTVVDPPPVVGIKAGAGSGKTGAAVEQIAAIPGVEHMNIEVFVPDHRLAEELAERVRDLVASRRAADFSGIDTNAELRVLVIRGRGALDTDGEPMCQKAELAEEVGRAGLDVKHTLCIGADGLCEFAEKCRHLGQFRDTRPAIRIMAHTAMFVRRNKKMPYPDLIVVDEAFWKAAIPAKPVRLALDRLTETGRWRVLPRKVPKAKDSSPEEQNRERIARAKARREAEDRKLEAERPLLLPRHPCPSGSRGPWRAQPFFASVDDRGAVTLLPSRSQPIRRRSAPFGRPGHRLCRSLEADLGVGAVAQRLLGRSTAAAQPDLALRG